MFITTEKLDYQPPYDWQHFLHFLSQRLVQGLESIDNGTYHRNICHDNVRGHFSISHNPLKNCFDVTIALDDQRVLPPVLSNIRRILDIDRPLAKIETILQEHVPYFPIHAGLRIPGIWSVFEAGIRAICGQQISIAAATTMVTQLVHLAGTQPSQGHYYFPTPKQLAEFDYSQLKTTNSRKETLMLFAHYCHNTPAHHVPDNWITLKGIGPWTINYVKLRGLSDPDIWMDSDLGIKNALQQHHEKHPNSSINAEECKPWRSYLDLQLWSTLNV